MRWSFAKASETARGERAGGPEEREGQVATRQSESLDLGRDAESESDEYNVQS